jgi:hypothetical protein
MTTVAVIGAGLSGLVVAKRLQPLADVTLFEKSRGPGGRMATRYAGDFEFDHGAQFFTARSSAFQAFLQPLIERGVVADWQGPFAELNRNGSAKLRTWDADYPHYVGTPRMNSIGKCLSEGLNIVLKTEITAINRTHKGWLLSAGAGTEFGPFDWLVMASPAPQTATLASAYPDLVKFSGERPMLGCFALMLGFEEPVDLPMQAAIVEDADISWISVNSSKPDRESPFTIVVHSTNAWATAHMEDDLDRVLEHMLGEASRITGKDLGVAEQRQVHRWRYANSDKQTGPTYFLDNDLQLAACGDWCIHGRIEAAFTSASGLAESLEKRLPRS